MMGKLIVHMACRLSFISNVFLFMKLCSIGPLLSFVGKQSFFSLISIIGRLYNIWFQNYTSQIYFFNMTTTYFQIMVQLEFKVAVVIHGIKI